MEKLYKVMEFTTTGWEVPGDEFKKLTKEVATDRINYLLNEGMLILSDYLYLNTNLLLSEAA